MLIRKIATVSVLALGLITPAASFAAIRGASSCILQEQGVSSVTCTRLQGTRFDAGLIAKDPGKAQEVPRRARLLLAG